MKKKEATNETQAPILTEPRRLKLHRFCIVAVAILSKPRRLKLQAMQNAEIGHDLCVLHRLKLRAPGFGVVHSTWYMCSVDDPMGWDLLVNYYSSLFFTASPIEFDSVLGGMETRVSAEMNDELLRPFESREVQFSLKQMDAETAPRQDGFPPLCYKQYCNKVGMEVSEGNAHKREKATPITDGGTSYYNMFDANYDTLVWALQKNGFGNLPIIVGEIGWPTDGDRNANIEYAQQFNQDFMTHILGGRGTPMRPGAVDVYLFSLIDEDAKSVQPGNFERQWGIFNYDGSTKYQLNLGTTNSGALVAARGVKYLDQKWCVMKPSAKLDDPQVSPSVSYACGLADCTTLGYGTSCANLDARVGSCKFPVMIEPYYGGTERTVGSLQKPVILASGLILFLPKIL
uniref:glucan endo-1,3-beta-D-glucosidase n=1 Tax=Quercus lobata TaxID=97700 RepID=A0A7N2MVB5_QUELO